MVGIRPRNCSSLVSVRRKVARDAIRPPAVAMSGTSLPGSWGGFRV